MTALKAPGALWSGGTIWRPKPTRDLLRAAQTLEQPEASDAMPGAGADDIARENRNHRGRDLELRPGVEKEREKIRVVVGPDQREEELLESPVQERRRSGVGGVDAAAGVQGGRHVESATLRHAHADVDAGREDRIEEAGSVPHHAEAVAVGLLDLEREVLDRDGREQALGALEPARGVGRGRDGGVELGVQTAGNRPIGTCVEHSAD
jgi:hypothetical protein